MKQEQTRKQTGRRPEQDDQQAETRNPDVTSEELAQAVDDTLEKIDDLLEDQLDEELLADIDDVLEDNAQEFVDNYVQQGGQ